jgi:hypothetical protein
VSENHGSERTSPSYAEVLTVFNDKSIEYVIPSDPGIRAITTEEHIVRRMPRIGDVFLDVNAEPQYVHDRTWTEDTRWEYRMGTTAIDGYNNVTDRRWALDPVNASLLTLDISYDESLVRSVTAIWRMHQENRDQVADLRQQTSDLRQKLTDQQAGFDAWKARAVEMAHHWADQEDFCSTFDDLMIGLGLPGRPTGWEFEVEVTATITVRVEETRSRDDAQEEISARSFWAEDQPGGEAVRDYLNRNTPEFEINSGKPIHD